MTEKILGILGGVGPMATVYFMELLVSMTEAERDQDHIPVLCFNDPIIPDRTAFILDQSNENPLPVMKRDARLLEKAGVSFIAIPCNTAHYFYDELQKEVAVPIISILETAIDYAVENNKSVKKVGILATDGTVRSGAYQNVCDLKGVECVIPDEKDQASLMRIIYDEVKAGKSVDGEKFLSIVDAMKKKGCDAIVLGCTELSIVRKILGLDCPDIVDSMVALAERCIILCGKEIKKEP